MSDVHVLMILFNKRTQALQREPRHQGLLFSFSLVCLPAAVILDCIPSSPEHQLQRAGVSVSLSSAMSPAVRDGLA